MEDYNNVENNKEEEEEEELQEFVQEIEDKGESNKKITLPIMTTYEKSNLISERIKQINSGYKSNLDEKFIADNNLISSYDIAIEEFEQKKLPPFIIKRPFPNGTYELWSLKDFKYFPK